MILPVTKYDHERACGDLVPNLSAEKMELSAKKMEASIQKFVGQST